MENRKYTYTFDSNPNVLTCVDTQGKTYVSFGAVTTALNKAKFSPNTDGDKNHDRLNFSFPVVFYGKGKFKENLETLLGTSITTKAREDDPDREELWLQATAWGATARRMHSYIEKRAEGNGTRVRCYLRGRVSVDEFTGRDGQSRSGLAMNVTEFREPSIKGSNGGGSANGNSSSATPAATAPEVSAPPTLSGGFADLEVDDEELPF